MDVDISRWKTEIDRHTRDSRGGIAPSLVSLTRLRSFGRGGNPRTPTTAGRCWALCAHQLPRIPMRLVKSYRMNDYPDNTQKPNTDPQMKPHRHSLARFARSFTGETPVPPTLGGALSTTRFRPAPSLLRPRSGGQAPLCPRRSGAG